MIYFFFKVNRADICRIKAIVEAYENMLNMSTVDENLPKIQITAAPDFHAEAMEILADLRRIFYMEEIQDAPGVSQGKY